MTPEDIRQRGLDALARELGLVGMIRFLQQFGNRSGDYTAEREMLLQNVSREEIISGIMQRRAKENQ